MGSVSCQAAGGIQVRSISVLPSFWATVSNQRPGQSSHHPSIATPERRVDGLPGRGGWLAGRFHASGISTVLTSAAPSSIRRVCVVTRSWWSKSELHFGHRRWEGRRFIPGIYLGDCGGAKAGEDPRWPRGVRERTARCAWRVGELTGLCAVGGRGRLALTLNRAVSDRQLGITASDRFGGSQRRFPGFSMYLGCGTGHRTATWRSPVPRGSTVSAFWIGTGGLERSGGSRWGPGLPRPG